MSTMRIDWARHGTRLLRIAPWAIPFLGYLPFRMIGRANDSAAQAFLTICLGAFFALLVARLLATAITQPKRRYPILALVAGVLLWAVGSVVLNASGHPDLTRFPAPGEVFFLLSYVSIAGYLISDARRTRVAAANTWLEMVIICGGTSCLAGGLIISPVARHLGLDGLHLLLAMIYPLIDIVLMLVVLGQWVVKQRVRLDEVVLPLLGFGCFVVADVSFVVNLSGGTYVFPLIDVLTWAAGFALITDQACRPRIEIVPTTAPTARTPVAVLAGAGCAVAVLASEPGGSVRSVLVIASVATLVATGARLVLAVRAANRAAAAVALSLSDDLTDLPNRRALYLRLERCIRSRTPHGLMIVDLDGFKDINDTLGHTAGDQVLRAVAVRARAAVPSNVLVARLGGDEFALLADTEDELDLHEIAQGLLAAVREPLIVAGIRLSVDASIGITTRSVSDTDTSELMRRADVAMYDAKQARLGVVLYDPTSDNFSRERLALGDDLRQAIAACQLELWYQPQYDTRTSRVCGLEALVRWQHPKHGLLNPVEFLPVARRLGLMLSLSEEIGRMAVSALAEWRRHGYDIRVAINCGAPELMSGVFLPGLASAASAAGVPTRALIVEVTEDTFITEPERARSLLLGLRDLGFEISVDDYGTGFSSLAYLRDLPIQEIKLDRSFVASMSSDSKSELIVASTVRLAEALNLRLVAEGVEDGVTASELTAMGAHVLQGYHLSRPMPHSAVAGFLARSELEVVGTGRAV